MSVFSKIKNCLENKKYKQLFILCRDYINYLRIKMILFFSLCETDPDLKKTNKNWAMYSYLKLKYKKYIRDYQIHSDDIHEYSDVVWWCWFQGEENAPEISKLCLNSLKENLPDKKIIVITEENMLDYVSFPDFIMKKYKKGIISKTHFSDLLRLELLINHGGTWIDSTCFCSKSPVYAFNVPLFVFSTRERNDPGIIAQSWFISSEKNNPILILTRDLLYKIWEENNHMLHYFVFFFCFKLAAEKYPDEWSNVPWYPDLPPHILQRELFTKYTEERWTELLRFSDIHKLSYKIGSAEDDDTFEAYLKNKYLYN